MPTATQRMFAATVPGLAPILGDQLGHVAGIAVSDAGWDGRADLVLFSVDGGQRISVPDLDVAEDIFVEVGRTQRADGDNPRWIAQRIWRPERVARALARWAEIVGSARTNTLTFRVVGRVLQERSFLRTDLRRELTRVIAADRPGWRVADPARLEVWIVEYRPGRFLAGLRTTDARMRQHGGRAVERTGALRPAGATAMVRQAGEPADVLLDPCCGSGTILAEAVRLGWSVRGVDIDPEAVSVARRNVRGGVIEVGDARRLSLPDATVAACVTNLPFGRQYAVQGDATDWLRAVLSELARVTRPGGRVVVLAPQLPRAAVPGTLRQYAIYPIRLLGTRTRMSCYDRRSGN